MELEEKYSNYHSFLDPDGVGGYASLLNPSRLCFYVVEGIKNNES